MAKRKKKVYPVPGGQKIDKPVFKQNVSSEALGVGLKHKEDPKATLTESLKPNPVKKETGEPVVFCGMGCHLIPIKKKHSYVDKKTGNVVEEDVIAKEVVKFREECGFKETIDNPELIKVMREQGFKEL